MLIAQITDLHIMPRGRLVYGSLDTTRYLVAAVARLNGLSPLPDLVLVTGDLVDAGSLDEYARLRAELDRLLVPYRLIPGNHDARDTLRATFADHAYLRSDPAFCHYVDEAWPVRIVGLDSLDPGRVDGLLCADRLAWLDRVLGAAPTRPTLVCVHHPPFGTGIAHMDSKPMRGADRFAAVIRAHPQVERVIAGHVHRAMALRWAGTICTTCPSTAHQFALDLAAGMPARWTREPPGFQLHHWAADGGLVTHGATIELFAPLALR